jgi:hypothetical protein
MRGADFLFSDKVSDGAGKLNDPVISPGGKPQLLGGCPKQCFTTLIELAEFPDFPRYHIPV